MATTWHYLMNLALDAMVLVFLVSALTKLFDRILFKHTLLLLVGERAAVLISYALPLAELGLAVALYCNFEEAKWAGAGLLAIFAAVAFAVRRRNIPCSCFGNVGGQTLSVRTVVRNGILIALIAATARLDEKVAGPESLLTVATAVVFFFSLSQCIQNLNTITQLKREGYL